MNKPSRISTYGLIGLAGFGVFYDCGLFGPTDGFDHSIMISMPSTATIGMPTYAVLNNITGEDVMLVQQPQILSLSKPQSA
jgi:hypothetical protein